MSELTTFVYLLGRDHLPAGTVEKLVAAAEEAGPEVEYSEPNWARWAESVADRLRGE